MRVSLSLSFKSLTLSLLNCEFVIGWSLTESLLFSFINILLFACFLTFWIWLYAFILSIGVGQCVLVLVLVRYWLSFSVMCNVYCHYCDLWLWNFLIGSWLLWLGASGMRLVALCLSIVWGGGRWAHGAG